MNRITRIGRDAAGEFRAWRAKRRLHAAAVIELTETVSDLRVRVGALEADVDELRSDSRRVAEMRIQLEDFLAERS